jgi:alpha-tubulin suppressor-like RCC1 family protein
LTRKVYSAGANGQGQLGLGSRYVNESRCDIPTKVSFYQRYGHPKIIMVSCGDNHSLMLTKESLVFGFGYLNMSNTTR